MEFQLKDGNILCESVMIVKRVGKNISVFKEQSLLPEEKP